MSAEVKGFDSSGRPSKSGMRLEVQSLIFGRNRSLLAEGAALDFAVGAGEILSLLGPNGRGKTTLLDTLSGVLKPLSGSVARYCRTGVVPQKFSTELDFSALDVVLMGRVHEVGLFSLPSKEDEEGAWNALRRLGVEHLASQSFRTLSGGEQQLVIFARALAADAKLLFLDEPTAALDLKHQETVLRLILELAEDDGVGIVFSTHDPMHAGLVSDKTLLLLSRGKSILGSTAEVLSSANLKRAFGVDVDVLAADEAADAARPRLVARFDLTRRSRTR